MNPDEDMNTHLYTYTYTNNNYQRLVVQPHANPSSRRHRRQVAGGCPKGGRLVPADKGLKVEGRTFIENRKMQYKIIMTMTMICQQTKRNGTARQGTSGRN